MKYLAFESIIGKIFVSVKASNDEVTFIEADGTTYKLCHFQDCCESVYIEDFEGDFSDLENTPIVFAEEITNTNLPPASECDDSYTWTFYKIATVKGWVDIRFFGTSNGYYSESVDFVMLD